VKQRYYIESGEPDHPSTDEREWNVYDRATPCGDASCYDCPGTVVHVCTTRRAAREVLRELRAGSGK
jgi:hypothetical protein